MPSYPPTMTPDEAESPTPSSAESTLLQYVKFLTVDGRGPYSDFDWPIDEWVEAEGPLELCSNGIHVCTIEQALGWLDTRCHPVEIRGEQLDSADKLCVRAAKLGPALDSWNDRTARLFAADCAERVLPIFERERPDDQRPRETIEVVRRFAAGDVTRNELAAAGDAARDAAGDAARDAARAAARAAAWAAARAAARDAARAAARAAAWAAARKWQTERLARILSGELYAEVSQ